MAPIDHDPESRFEEFRRSGDPRALGDVYDLLAPELLRIALHTTRDAATAEDVLQATFVAAIQQAERYDPERRLMPWLVGILANEAARSKSRAARAIDPERVEFRAAESPEEAAQRAELLELLEEAFERIPAAYRPVLQLRLRHGLTLAEIAAALERPPGTVRSQLARGTELLRRMLPASLAGILFALVTPTRGLAAIKNELLAHALPAKAGAGFFSFALGIVAMKKFVIAGLALTALVWWWRVESRTEAEAPARAEIGSDHALAKDVAVAPEAEALPAADGRRAESAQAS
ncbi:MAG TPA: sigma-70 family RNA polymerase sigma factor, partial [Planctomycetota bacterium]|nr:sigma-70 family RNA polymerase sigma factor [Planctomycetota bacterium]